PDYLLEGKPNRLIDVDLPESHAAIAACGPDRLAVRAEGNRADRAEVLHGITERPADGRVPDPSCAVPGSREEELAVGAERHIPNLIAVPLHGRTEGLAGRGVPELRRAVRAPGQECLTVGTECDAPARRRIREDGAGRPASGCVPEHRAVR